MTNSIKTVFLMTLMTVLLVAIGGAIGGKSGLVIALAIAVITNLASYWFSDKIVLSMYKAQEVDQNSNPRLYNIVSTLSARANMPMPKVYMIMSGSPNAFATGRNRNNAVVAVTNSLMDMLTDEELAGVVGHELAHIDNKDILIGTIVAIMAGTIMTLVNILQWGMIFGGGNNDEESSNPLGIVVNIAIIIFAPIAASLIQMAVSRSREYLADAKGAEFCGNPRALASALHKIAYGVEMNHMDNATPQTAHMFIMNPLSGGKVANLFSTHPDPEDRIRRLNAMAENNFSGVKQSIF